MSARAASLGSARGHASAVRVPSPMRVPSGVLKSKPTTAGGMLFNSAPTWSNVGLEVTVQHSVQAQLQAFVEPRLESLADRLGCLVASAQNDIRETERRASRTEARIEDRVGALEMRADRLLEGAAKAEQRERELNLRLAHLATNMLSNAESPHCNLLEQFDRKLGAHTQRLDDSERQTDRDFRRLEERLDDVFGAVAANVECQLRECRDAQSDALRSARTSNTGEDARVSALEEHVRAMGCALRLRGIGDQPDHQQLWAKSERRMDAFDAIITGVHRRLEEVRRYAEQVGAEASRVAGERSEEFRSSLRQDSDLAPVAEETKDSLEEMQQRLGAMKVKLDACDGRVAVLGERFDAARQAGAESQSLRHEFDERCDHLAAETTASINAVERRVVSLQHAFRDLEDDFCGARAANDRPASSRSSSESRRGSSNRTDSRRTSSRRTSSRPTGSDRPESLNAGCRA